MDSDSVVETKNDRSRLIIEYILWGLFYLCLLKQLSVLKLVLDQMSTTNKQFPLQTFLGYFQIIWDFTDKIWKTILGNKISYHLFENYIWGGFTYMAFIWSILQYNRHSNNILKLEDSKLVNSRRLLLLYILFFALTILYGLNRDQWIPYVQEPTWVINLAHKQQVSAGTFLIVYYFIYVSSYFPSLKSHQGSMKFLNQPKLIFYTFVCMNLDNLASFNWFPGPIDPHNTWIRGYEEIFQEGQTWTSSDKIYHFTMSSVAVIIMLMYVPDTKKAISGAISTVIFWELFEISLNPRESSDSLLDMVINTTAILIASFLMQRNAINNTIPKNYN